MFPDTFRVYPQKPWRYDVLVFRSQKPMYAYAEATWGDRDHDWAACVFTRKMLKAKTRSLGEILFQCRLLTPEIVSHESTHAAHNFYSLRSGKKSIYIVTNGAPSASEEIIARLQADISRQIMDELATRGLIKA